MVTMRGRASKHAPMRVPLPPLALPAFLDWVELHQTQAHVAARLGVTRPLVSQWLSGTRIPSKTVLILASLLAREPVDLADGLPPAG